MGSNHLLSLISPWKIPILSKQLGNSLHSPSILYIGAAASGVTE